MSGGSSREDYRFSVSTRSALPASSLEIQVSHAKLPAMPFTGTSCQRQPCKLALRCELVIVANLEDGLQRSKIYVPHESKDSVVSKCGC